MRFLKQSFLKLYSNFSVSVIYFRLLREDVEITDIMKKNASVNELRYLGYRSY